MRLSTPVRPTPRRLLALALVLAAPARALAQAPAPAAAPAPVPIATPPAGAPAAAPVPPVVGRWQTVDDTTHEPTSIVEISRVDGRLVGKVVKRLKQDGIVDKRCDRCDGERKHQPILGMVIMWDLVEHDGVWEHGHILDPDNGKIYGCRVEAKGPDALEVRGFVGLALFGRSQTWHRAPPDA